MLQYFDVRDLIRESPNTHVFNIVGQGGVGKTYSLKKVFLLDFFTSKCQFVYIRRWTTEVQGSELDTVFTDSESDEEINEAWADSEYSSKYVTWHIMKRGVWFWLVGEKENTEIDWIEKIGRITALSKAQRFKGGTYNNFKYVLLDEAVSNEGYVDGSDEPERLQMIINTIGRAENEIYVFIVGNPDSNIEACPYFTSLRLDYAHLQPNTVYYYDKRLRNGKILANNICFIKLANFAGKESATQYLNEYTADIWETPQGEMRTTGEVLTRSFPQLATIGTVHIDVYYKIIMETPIFAVDEYRRKLHVYFGYWNDPKNGYEEPVTVVSAHVIKDFEESVSDDMIIYSRYDQLVIRPMQYKQMLRFNLPAGPRWAPLHEIIAGTASNGFLLTDNNAAATLYTELVNQ